jgi:hypothetical protein
VLFSLEQFDSVLNVRDANGRPFLLIGGQAVYFWASRYAAKEPSLFQFQPFTSKDIDFQGTRADILRIAKHFGRTAKLPHKREMTAFAGMVEIPIGNDTTKIEVIRRMPNVRPADAINLAIEREFFGKIVRVVDPVSLLYCKTYLALRVNQTNRRDSDHMRIMIICVRAFLRETLAGVNSGDLPARGWLGATERVLKLGETSLGRKAASKLKVDWQEALPQSDIASSHHRIVVQLRDKRLPQWRSNLGSIS